MPKSSLHRQIVHGAGCFYLPNCAKITRFSNTSSALEYYPCTLGLVCINSVLGQGVSFQ